MQTITQADISRRENLNEMVVNYIKESILYGIYKGGDRIIENELSLKLEISRAPIREGIRQLEQEGIITSIPRKGSYITKFDVNDIKEVFDIRLLLENDIIEILIKGDLLDEKDFVFLTEIVDEMVDIVKSDLEHTEKALQINLRDMEFHKYLWNKSGSTRRVVILQGLFFQLRMAMMYDMEKTDDLLVSATDHYKIIDGLRSKDIERCKKELSEHIITYRN